MSAIDPREFGQLEQKVDNLDEKVGRLDKNVEHLAEKVDELLELANKGKGAWWAGLTTVSALSGAITFFVSTFFHK